MPPTPRKTPLGSRWMLNRIARGYAVGLFLGQWPIGKKRKQEGEKGSVSKMLSYLRATLTKTPWTPGPVCERIRPLGSQDPAVEVTSKPPA